MNLTNEITFNQAFTSEELDGLPIATTQDWQDACAISPWAYMGLTPIEWVLMDGFGDPFAVATKLGGE